MELDALILFVKVFKDWQYSDTDKLLMLSYITNSNININLSLRDNALEFNLNDFDLTEQDILKEILANSNPILNIPIYRVLLQKIELFDILKESYAKKILELESIIDIIENILCAIEEIDNNYQISFLIKFLMDLISTRKIPNVKNYQNSVIINNFIKRNESLIKKELNRKESNYDIEFYKRLLIFKLFTCGFVNFNYNQVLDPNSQEDGLINIVKPLIENRNYGHLKLMLNKNTLSEESGQKFIEFIKYFFEECYEPQNEMDIEKDKKFINDINLILKQMRIDALNYNDLIRKNKVYGF